MKFPSVYPLTIPSSQRMIRRIAIVSSIASLLRARPLPAQKPDAIPSASTTRLSNGCATRRVRLSWPRVLIVLLTLVALGASETRVEGQDTKLKQKPSNEHRAASIASFLGGAAVGLGAHEAGHLVFDGIFGAHPGVKGVSFHGIPFFAITHDGGLSPRREFTIDSAGFWVQHATNEIILTRHPNVRDTGSPFVKGLFAFNVLAS